MGHSATTWAGYGFGARISSGVHSGSDALRAILEAEDIDEAFEEWLEAEGFEHLVGEMGGDMVYGENELWSVVASGTVTVADAGTYEIVSEPTPEETDELRRAAELLGGAWRSTWRIQTDFG